MPGMGPETSCHHDESKNKTKEDLKLVKKMNQEINEKFVNSFKCTNETGLFMISWSRTQF